MGMEQEIGTQDVEEREYYIVMWKGVRKEMILSINGLEERGYYTVCDFPLFTH